MNKYESVIITPILSDSKLAKVTKKVEDKISEYGKILEKQDYGERHLAYEIKKNKDGHYFIYKFEVDDATKSFAIKELERLYRITDEIIKFITISLEE